MIDKEEIVRALTLWFQPGDVFEIRALGASTGLYRNPHTETGYFDYEHIKEAAAAIGKIHSADGIYVTINPVKRDLLARAVYKMLSGKNIAATGDDGILRRHWLLIDCDPARESGIASNDAEHECAIEKAKAIRDELAKIGWSDPILTDSGNGAHLTYRIDLPADDGGLVQNILTALQFFSDDKVKIDLSVFNPARIVRLPGTMNRKGDDADGKVCGRPHRMARIIDAPAEPVAVKEDLLKVVLGSESSPAQTSAKSEIRECDVEDGFDLDEWIAKYAPDAGQPREYKGGRLWQFKVCPFNPAHNNSATAIFQFPSGKPGFKCQHDGCHGNDWVKFRVLRQPGCYDHKKPPEYPDVDVSGILAQKSKSQKTAEKKTEDSVSESVIPMPEELLNVPGFVSDVVAFDLATAPCPNPVLALAGALALQAHLIGGKVCAPGGSRAAIYIVSLGKSGIGKEHPRKVNKAILNAIGIANTYAENVASGQALEDRIAVTNPLLWLCDEFHAVLKEVVQDTTGTKENLFKTLLTVYSSADTFMALRDKVGRTNQILNNPILNLQASCTPGKFYESINANVMDHGMYSRMSIFSASPRHPNQLPGDVTNVPKNIFDRAKRWLNYQPPGSGNIGIVCRTLPASEETQKLMVQTQKEAQDEYNRLGSLGAPEWQTSIWTRVYENLLRYAIVYACSQAATPEDAELTPESILWAKKLIFWEAKNKIALTNRYYYETEFARYSGAVIEVLSNWRRAYGDEPMPGYRFNRSMKQFPPKVLAAVIESLQAQERIEVISNFTGRNGRKYRLKTD